MRSGLWLGIAFITLIFVAVGTYAAVNAWNRSARAQDDLLPVSDRKPININLPTLDGKEWSLADHKGRIVLVNYFATWCPPCKAEFVDLKKMLVDYGKKGVDFAAISVDRDAARSRVAALRDFSADEHLPFPILLPAAESPLLRDDLMVPQTFLVDRQGRIALHLIGQLDPKNFRRSLDKLLAEAP